MFENPAVALMAAAVGWFVLMRRAGAFRLRTDFWGMMAALLLMPILIVQILWRLCPEWLQILGVAPSFLLAQFAIYQATLVETDRLRALRREVSRWRLLTGTPPRNYRPVHTVVAPDRRLTPKAMALGSAVAGAVAVYAVLVFGWNSLMVLAVFFWAFMALYQFSFSPDN